MKVQHCLQVGEEAPISDQSWQWHPVTTSDFHYIVIMAKQVYNTILIFIEFFF